MKDDKLAVDEARRAAQHESVKARIEDDVNAEVAERADQPTATEAHRVDRVAREFREKAVGEVVQTEREVERSRVASRISQVIDYFFFILYGLLAMRFFLELLAARQSAGFVQLINALTNPFYAPFRGIVASPTAEGGFRLALPVLIALIAYILLHMAINGLLRLLAHRKTAV